MQDFILMYISYSYIYISFCKN
uniref:Uncharacterized protein n=1 Tax=Anguilla anguilla TaxID=7936 RepID=A0A0E9R3P8_ANGAN